MSCLTKIMIERGATITEVQAVLNADALLNSERPASDLALDRAQETIDRAAVKWLGFNEHEEAA